MTVIKSLPHTPDPLRGVKRQILNIKFHIKKGIQ